MTYAPFMLPKSSKHYIIPTAEKLDMEPQLVEDVIAFYYSTLRKSLSGLAHQNITVENLGLFKVKIKELPSLNKKYEKQLSILTKETFSQMTLRKEVLLKQEKLRALQQIIEKEKTRKKKFLQQKHGKDEQNNTNMASKKTNS